MPVAMDVCGMESIPLNCAPSSSSCLCKPGHNTSATCLGKPYTDTFFLISLTIDTYIYMYVPDFLPFDDRAGDETLVRSNRAQVTASSNLTLPIPVVLYDQQHREIQVKLVSISACIN